MAAELSGHLYFAMPVDAKQWHLIDREHLATRLWPDERTRRRRRNCQPHQALPPVRVFGPRRASLSASPAADYLYTVQLDAQRAQWDGKDIAHPWSASQRHGQVSGPAS